MRKKYITYELLLTAIFISLSIIVGLFEIPMPPMKLDLSEVIILVSLYFLGILKTIPVILFRSIIRYLLLGGTDIPFVFFGELIAIFASFVLVFTTWIFLKVIRKYLNLNKSSTTDFLIGYILSALVMVVVVSLVLTVFNILIIYPAFLSFGKYYFLNNSFIINILPKSFLRVNDLKNYLIAVIGFVLPFNIIKFSLTYYFFAYVVRKIDTDKLSRKFVK